MTQLFESSLPKGPKEALDAMFLHHFDHTMHNTLEKSKIVSPALSLSGLDLGADVVDYIGDYLVETSKILAQLVNNLIEGQHIKDASIAVHKQSRETTRLADLSTISAMDAGLSRLRQIRDLTNKYTEDLQAAWEQPRRSTRHETPPTKMTPRSPIHEAVAAAQSMPAAHDVDQGYRARKLLPDNPLAPRIGEISGSEDSDDDDDDEEEHFANIDMDALRQRGKGTYYCPIGLRCDKGGVDKDGKLIQFDRNSSFAQHCNKHRKPWRCDTPGCPNPPKKRRFARRDGLERHKATVKHMT